MLDEFIPRGLGDYWIAEEVYPLEQHAPMARKQENKRRSGSHSLLQVCVSQCHKDFSLVFTC